MARQNRSTKSTDTSTEDVATPNTEEAPVAESTPAEGTTPEAPKAEEVPVDLTAFKQAVSEALAEGDTSTGVLPEAAVTKVNEAYRAVDGNKGKRAARDFLQESMLEAVGKLDAVAARGYSDLSAKLTAAGGSKAEKAPADPTAAFVQRLASLQLALSIVEADRPEGVEDEKLASTLAEAQTLYAAHVAHEANEAEDKGEGPTLTPVVRAAIKAAAGKASGGRGSSTGGSTGPRRDTGKHIANAFEKVEVGTFLTIAEIAKEKSPEYGDDVPSQGAISARLFPTTTVPGIEPVEKGAIDGKNPKGARKIAVEA